MCGGIAYTLADYRFYIVANLNTMYGQGRMAEQLQISSEIFLRTTLHPAPDCEKCLV